MLSSVLHSGSIVAFGEALPGDRGPGSPASAGSYNNSGSRQSGHFDVVWRILYRKTVIGEFGSVRRSVILRI